MRDTREDIEGRVARFVRPRIPSYALSDTFDLAGVQLFNSTRGLTLERVSETWAEKWIREHRPLSYVNSLALRRIWGHKFGLEIPKRRGHPKLDARDQLLVGHYGGARIPPGAHEYPFRGVVTWTLVTVRG